MKTWFTVVAAVSATATAAAKPAEISIFDDIGAYGVSARQFIAELNKLGQPENVTLFINSPGGSVFDGYAMYNALKLMRDKGTKVTARVMGIAASAASVVAMAANTIDMPENTMMMVHYASGIAFGNAEDMRDTANVLDQIDNALVGIYTARTGKTDDEVRALLKDETFMSATEAKAAGFATNVIENIKATNSFDSERLETLPESVRALFKPVPEAKSPLAIEIETAATAAGFGAFAAHFALTCDTLEAATAAFTAANEVKGLCAVAKKPDMLGELITAKLTLTQVRAKLTDAVAADGGNDVDNHQPDANSNEPPNKAPVGVSPSAIWAARNKQVNPQKGA